MSETRSRGSSLDLSKIDPASILGRPELPTPLDAVRRELGGRRLLVTGAGGSVGTELATLLLGLEPASLTLLDHHDHALFTLERRLDTLSPNGPWSIELVDLRNRARLAHILDEARPEVVFHLAAYKHVSLGEKFPGEAFGVNVLATASLLDLAGERAVERLVYPSSDKAVNPPSLYGATKRISEVLVRRAARDFGRRYVVARYVNILGTRGSVIETFVEQLAAGLPLTVTDASMTRYWISMREATWLLVQAAALGQPGTVLMLDAREEVSVVAVAQRVAALLAPDAADWPLRFTGTRPGERLREELLSEQESFGPGPCDGILAVSDRRHEEHLAGLGDHLARLIPLADGSDGAQLKAAAMEAARALQ